MTTEKTRDSAKAEAELGSLTLRMGEAEKNRDATFFTTLLADTLTFRRASTVVVNKETFLRDLSNPANTYEILEPKHISAQIYEGVAVVTLLIHAKGMREGKPFGGVFRNIRTFLHEPAHIDQPWQLHAWFNVRVPDL